MSSTTKRRDLWRFERAAGFTSYMDGPSSWHAAECWEVTIDEERTASIRQTFAVRGELIAQIHPERYDHQTRTMLPVEAEPVPGVYVPIEPYRFKSLGLARERARRLITVLSGKMYFEQVRLHKST